ncbi:MAG: hypothetical protein ACPLXR_10010, partial [Halothiobacillaceae bacterium]
KQNGNRYRVNTVGEKALNAWDAVLGKPAISELRENFYRRNQAYGRLSDYRNYNTHSVMTQDEIDEAVRRFMGANIWAQGLNTPASRPKPGKCFLSRPLVKNVIQSLIDEKADPAQLYMELLGQLSARLIDPDAKFARSPDEVARA